MLSRYFSNRAFNATSAFDGLLRYDRILGEYRTYSVEIGSQMDLLPSATLVILGSRTKKLNEYTSS